ncbi:MAG: phage tail protein [Anaerolineae bacterium]|nr:phage tail protein [Anaerolineae bacterium]
MPFLVRPSSTKSLGPSAHDFGADLLEYEYKLTVEGKVTGFFQRMTGGKIEVGTISHDIVYENGTSTTLFIPGTTSFEPITLERGFANYQELYNWLMEASYGRITQARRDGSIEMTRRGQPLLRWDFSGAWPTTLSGFSLNQYQDATKARVSITIAVEAIEYVEIEPPEDEDFDAQAYFTDLFS